RPTAAAADRSENQRAGLHVFLDARLHRGATLAPARELLDQPVIDPLRLLQERDFLALAFAMLLSPQVLAHEHLELAVREDGGAALAIDANVLLVERVEADRVRYRALVDRPHAIVERHRHDAVGIARVLGPGRLPGRCMQRPAA